MRTLKVYRHGVTMGTAPSKSPTSPAKRGQVQGWSPSATRRNIQFLRSVDERTLTGCGIALTLTLKDCPATSADWDRLRRLFIKRSRRLGLIRGHWVTEWQRRGVPHLHGAFWFDTSKHSQTEIVWKLREHWLEIAAEYGVKPSGQHFMPITDAIGWFQYVSKHAARGVRHYQRNSANIPPSWQKKTGRVWGYIGDWVTVEPAKLELSSAGYYSFRRLVRSWRVADARKSGNRFRIRSARGMLRCHDRTLSEIRGVSEWLGEQDALRLVEVVYALGHQVEC